MKAILTFIAVALAALGLYRYYSGGDLLKNITIKENIVIVDAGDFDAEFAASGGFSQTYMLFGGGYFKEKNLVNPISLSGLEIADAKNMYARYPDFYRCKSPGAPVAQPLVKHLNLIPVDSGVLKALREAIEEHDYNLANDGDRVCVSLVGKTLNMRSARVHKDNVDIKDQLPAQTFYLANSSQRVDCKNLLDEKGSVSEGKPVSEETAKNLAEVKQMVTSFLEILSRGDMDGVYALTIEAFRKNIPRDETRRLYGIFFGQKNKFKSQRMTNYRYGKGTVETLQRGVYRDEIVHKYDGVITFSDGSEGAMMFIIIKEGNQWKVQYFDINLS